jgi:hypothetical protein
MGSAVALTEDVDRLNEAPAAAEADAGIREPDGPAGDAITGSFLDRRELRY